MYINAYYLYNAYLRNSLKQLKCYCWQLNNVTVIGVSRYYIIMNVAVIVQRKLGLIHVFKV